MNNEIADKWGVKPIDLDDNYQRNEGANSEHDFVGSKVKRDNLIQIFLRGTEVDKYIATHLYGQQKFKNFQNDTVGENTMLDDLDLDETFTHQMKALHQESFRYGIGTEEIEPKGKKMNAFETYIAIIKGYCALMILVLPRAFGRGGYIFSPIVMMLSGAV